MYKYVHECGHAYVVLSLELVSIEKTIIFTVSYFAMLQLYDCYVLIHV